MAIARPEVDRSFVVYQIDKNSAYAWRMVRSNTPKEFSLLLSMAKDTILSGNLKTYDQMLSDLSSFISKEEQKSPCFMISARVHYVKMVDSIIRDVLESERKKLGYEPNSTKSYIA